MQRDGERIAEPQGAGEQQRRMGPEEEDCDIRAAREVYGARLGFVPYHRPGFGLAKAAAEVFDANPSVEGLILDKHGIFTFGASAREAYERMIEMVTLAEQRLQRGRKRVFASASLPSRLMKMSQGIGSALCSNGLW